MNRVTFSATPRVSACPPSAVLPAVREAGEGSDAARRGTAVHAFLANCINLGSDAALVLVSEEFHGLCFEIDITRLPAGKPDQFAAEVALAYNWKTGQAREIGRDLNRSYDGLIDDSCEIAGAADTLGFYLAGDTVFVDDYKTGWADLGDAGNSWQLKTLALAAARAYGVGNARVTFRRVREGANYYQAADLSELDLDLHAQKVREMMESLEVLRAMPLADVVRTAEFTEGAHCRYCPAYARCPAKTQLAMVLANSTSDLSGAELDNVAALTALANYQRATELLERVRLNLEAYAERTPIELEDGRVWGRVDSTVDSLLVDASASILAVKYGTTVVSDAIETTTKITKSALEAALRRNELLPKPYGKNFDALIEELRAAGAIKETPRQTFKIHKPKPKADQPKLPEAP